MSRVCLAQSVERLSSHLPWGSSMLHPGLSPTNVCTQMCGSKWFSCHTGHQEVIRCHTRGETEVTKYASKGIHPGFETQGRSPK